jgi:hypothetical protein
MDFWIGLFISYIHNSEIQVITAPQLISTIHISSQQPLSFFQPTVSSPAFPCQRLLTVEIPQLHAHRFYHHNLPCRTLWQLQNSATDYQLNSGNLIQPSQSQVKSKSNCDWRSVNQYVLASSPIMARYLLLFDSYFLLFVGRPFWREDGSVFWICCWPSPGNLSRVRVP